MHKCVFINGQDKVVGLDIQEGDESPRGRQKSCSVFIFNVEECFMQLF